MYLKSLKLVGFKSFADRTRLELRPGVTVIVGPNGSGKSNVVDAVSWVMGTQSAKALRTGKMEDVVFAGTATRPALNRAEATVVIDNTERLIDLDLDEVSITRRLYRDGSSDYELNGVGCRLLDIQELLSDSGVGRHQHVIIGQGQVDGVLSASPEDHRAVIEEAAGILKHRRRKEKAERRLERTDEDLVRLTDLLGEIARQMKPLRRQARAAERYQGLKDNVTALTLYISGETLKAIEAGLAASGSEKAELEKTLARESERVETLSQDLSRLTAEAGLTGADLERDSSAAAVLETTTERLRRTASIAHERRRALSGRRQAAFDRRADLETERQALLEELELVEASQPAAAAEAESSEGRFRQLEAEQQAVATQNSVSPEGAVAAVRGELSVIEAATIRDRREIESIEKRLEVVTSQKQAEMDEVARINDEIKEIDSRSEKAQADYEKSKNRRTMDQDAWTGAEKRLSEAKMSAASARARTEAIRSAIAGRFDEEARARVEAASGAIGTLISRLDVPN
ncbi:MAG: AAA family ATPase, partial [Acidimicrobiia bacterium]|nr:AAA family ATPase [Acidimicrobiia bacterium]